MKNKINNALQVGVAGEHHIKYVDQICEMINEAAKKRGTGIARRTPEYLSKKIQDGKAIIALKGDQLAGFCYIETWGHGKYTANSGLIVHPDFQGVGIGKKIKEKAFQLSRKKYPGAKIFGITTSLAVMKINSSLGYEPVTFSELTNDEEFWKGCSGCVNYDILNRTQHKHCLCTGMLYDPGRKNRLKNGAKERWKRFLETLKKFKTKKTNGFETEISPAGIIDSELIKASSDLNKEAK